MRGIEAAVLILPALRDLAALPTLLRLAPALLGCLLWAAFDMARARNGRLLSFATTGRRGSAQ